MHTWTENRNILCKYVTNKKKTKKMCLVWGKDKGYTEAIHELVQSHYSINYWKSDWCKFLLGQLLSKRLIYST